MNNKSLPEQLRDFVGQHGLDSLCSPYLGGMLEDALIFRTHATKPYKGLFRLMIAQGDMAAICRLGSWDDAQIAQAASAIAPRYNGTADIRYAIESIGYALGQVQNLTSCPAMGGNSQDYKLGERAVPYQAHGSTNCIGTMIPTCMALDVHRHLRDIEDEAGSVMQYVMDEMHEQSPAAIEAKISGEQIDGVAMAIRQMKAGRGFILGDMTGVGKGRQLAMLLKWAQIQGRKPVFVTEKSLLFRDLYRDLQDVGYADLRPFILNSDKDAVITDSDGNVMYDLPTADDMDDFMQHKQIPAGYDLLLLTYSQMARDRQHNPKAESVEACIANSYLILDESHNATGSDSNTGTFFRTAVQSALGVCFSSATYAKYPSSMPLYALKTAMGEANVSADDLIHIIETGGPILQEVMAKGLVASGSMVRRQRDMSGVEFGMCTPQDDAAKELMKARYNMIVELIDDIHDFQENYIDQYLFAQSASRIVRANVKKIRPHEKNLKKRINMAKFSTRMTPAISQLLFAIKTEMAIDATIAELRAGRKPIVQIARTMESGLTCLAKDDPDFARADFALNLLPYLDSMFSFRAELTTVEKVGNKNVTRNYSVPVTFTLDDLARAFGSSEVKAAYNYLVTRIKAIDSGLPLSPIDYFVQRIEAEGYTVGELTQRSNHMAYADITAGANSRATWQARKKANKKTSADAFNSGNLDVLIGNRVMSSGISLHSSTTFADQRQRVVITWEQQASADTQMQFNGRADRTGQVSHCAFVVLSSAIPAEQRFLMMNNRKQLSLNANVEASQQSDDTCVDIINRHGAEVLVEFMKENPEYASLFDFSGQKYDSFYNSPKVKKPGAASIMNSNRKIIMINDFMRALCLLDCEQQESILNDIQARFQARMAYLDEIGENDLVTTAKPLEASLIARTVFSRGSQNTSSFFAKDATLDEVEVNVLRKPLSAGEITELHLTMLQAATVEQKFKDYCAAKVQGIRDYYRGLRDLAKAQMRQLLAQSPDSYRPSRLRELERRANNAEAMQSQIDRVTETEQEVCRLLSLFQPLAAVGISINLDGKVIDPFLVNHCVSTGLFLGFKLTSDKITPSSIKACFAVNDSRRFIQIPLNQSEKLLSIKAQSVYGLVSTRLSKVTLASWDSLTSRATREKAYIVTGNIILGIAKAMKMPLKVSDLSSRSQIKSMCSGQMINYTDSAGRVRTGYQLSPFFNPTVIKKYIS